MLLNTPYISTLRQT